MTQETSLEIIERISRQIDQAEINRDPYSLIEARRLLRNDLPRAIEKECAWAKSITSPKTSGLSLR